MNEGFRKRMKAILRKFWIKNLIPILIILCLVFLLPVSVMASPQAVPPFVTTTLAPNVMISIDTSGSMRWGHSGLSYPDDAVYVISKEIYDTNYGAYSGDDVKAEVIQVADDINDPADAWLPNLPGLTGSWGYYRYDPAVFIDLTTHVADIKSALSSSDHTVMTIGGVEWIFFKGSWGASNYIFLGPNNMGYLSRITMAKWVITKLIRNTTGIQYGIMRFENGCNQRTGGRIVFPCLDLTKDYDGNGHPDQEDLINYVNSIYADGCTPLANTLYEACCYFGGLSSPSGASYSGAFAPKIMDSSGHYVSPIQYWCQKSFVILMTDGESFEDGGNVPADIQDYDNDNNSEDGSHKESDSLDDVAKYAYEHDFSDKPNGPDGKSIQNFSTYTIGFGGAAATLLQEAADDDHGHGEYYGTTGQGSLYASLQSAISDIMYRISSGTAVAFLSTSKSARDRLFRAKFHPRGWKGFLECYRLPYTGGSPIWEAGGILVNRDPDDRKIYVATSPTQTTRTNFKTGNSSLTKGLLGVSTNDERNHLINYIRGAYDSSWGYRDRDPNGNGGNQWKLGDIIYSTPVVRAEPNAYWDSVASSPAFDSYSEFKSYRYNRRALVIVGANDGMIHAFQIRGTNKGKEIWAFVPYNLLYNLKSLANDPYAHNYYVDLTPVIADCQVGSSVTDDHGWKTILLSGERQGGKAYFALDVTGNVGQGYPLPLWEFTDANLGESWSVPQIRIASTNSGYKWIGVFGSGYGNADTKGHLFGVNMADGNGIFDLTVDGTLNNVMASPVAIDFNDNSLMDRIYIGDMAGRMWKITPKTNEVWGDATTLQASILTSTGFTVSGHYNTQPIRIKPSLSFYDRTSGKVMAVYFGTGKFDLVEDKDNKDTQSFYCVLDEGATSLTRSDLVNSDDPKDGGTPISGYCSEHGQIPSDKHGWYFDMPNPGERVTASSLLAGGIVFFTTFTPNNDVCGYGGVARLYAVKYDTGCAPDNPVLDLNGDNVVDSSDTSTGQPGGEIPKSVIIGNGLPSAPVFDSKNNQIIVQTSDTTVHVRTVKLHSKSFKVHYWREVFQ